MGRIINREILAQANVTAAKHFFSCLQQDSVARSYVTERISKETAWRFRLGFTGVAGSLIDHLNENNVPAEVAAALGLILLDEQGKASEVLYNRVVFPIFQAGMIVAFGGRVLGRSKAAKYINTRTSPLYSKSEILYGLWNNRNAVSNTRELILVEGYFDMLGLWDHKIRNVAALCGTELTAKHVRYIRRYAEKVYLLLDPDDAGRQAARKSASLLAKNGVECAIVRLPDGLDPDEFVARFGKDGLLDKIRDAT